jgi:arylsulfatase
MAVYAAQVTCMDRGIGRILEALREAGAEANTLVLFLSDNGAAPDGGLAPTAGGFGFTPAGPNDTWRLDGAAIRPGSGPSNMPGPHDTFAAYGLGWATASNTPLRATKLTAYEGGIRTPLVVRWPAVIGDGGQVTGQVGHVIDLMATCLDAAGADYPEDFHGRKPLPLEGKSLVPIFRGHQRPPHEALCWSVPRNQAIRTGRWKLVNSGRGRPWELYDLETDGTETADLAGEHPDRVREMARRFGEWQERVQDR